MSQGEVDTREMRERRKVWSFSLSPALLAEVDYQAKQSKLSRSRMLEQLVWAGLSHVRGVENCPPPAA